ncbi:hypothetical protein PVAP13_9NG389300 [Panicum virgatum]|uniref:Uncharacterized protein n=1 Tax=Panicum virgatum TaxID=38727 RepID=A0A8T0MNN6_PANVG|nr:hypothetical protein PVAP13_9NG389300 [Panicum virgatum]
MTSPPPSLRSLSFVRQTVPPRRLLAHAGTPLAPHLLQARPPTSPRHASRQFHLAAALTPPPPALSRARATRLRRLCSPTGGRFTTSGARHAAAAAHPLEADSPPNTEKLRRRIATTKQLRSRPPPAGFRPNPALSTIGEYTTSLSSSFFPPLWHPNPALPPASWPSPP